MIFLLQGDLGDQICMLPALVAQAKRFEDNHWLDDDFSPHNEMHALIIADPRIKSLIPKYTWMFDERKLSPHFAPNLGVSINVWDAVENFGKNIHPTEMFFRYLGLPVPGNVMRPEIAVDESAPAYDYVIAPFANDVARAMPYSLLVRILSEFHSNGDRVCIVGSLRDEALIPKPHYAHACLRQQFLGKPLPYVAGLMRNARKAVITVDSMANRLAHAAGIENHVLLCSDVVPEVWATHPGARVLYGNPDSWRVDKVLELIP